MNDIAHANLLYSIKDLGEGNAEDINAAGQITGTYVNSAHQLHAFVSDGGSNRVDLGTLGGSSYGHALNASGMVTGWSEIAPNNYYRAAFVTHNNGQLINLGTLGGRESLGTGINDRGQIVGWSETASQDTYRAFIKNTNGSLTDLGTLGGARSQAQDINNAGQATGWDELIPNIGVHHGFTTDSNGNMTDLGSLSGYSHYSYGNAINDIGQVTGSSDTVNGEVHAFVTDTNGRMLDLGVLDLGPGDAYSLGYTINNAGQVVGSSFNPSVGGSAFVTENGVMLDLNTLLIPGTTDWHLEEALGINDKGLIVGWGDKDVTNYECPFRDQCGYVRESHGFLLTPATVPIPASLWLFGSALAALANFKNRRNGVTHSKQP